MGLLLVPKFRFPELSWKLELLKGWIDEGARKQGS